MRRLVVALVVASAVGCAERESATGLSDEQFVSTIVELRRASQAKRDAAEFAAEKQRILTEHNVTEAALRAYIEAHARDLDHLAAVWESVNVRLSVPAGPQ